MKKFFKKTIRVIGFHGGVLLRGLFQVVSGAVFTTGIVVGIYGLTQVADVGGYEAVSAFVVSLGTVFGSVMGIYLTGITTQKGA